VAALPRDTEKAPPPKGVKRFRIAIQPPPERQTTFPARPEAVVAIVHPRDRADARGRDLPPDAAPPYVFFPSDVRYESQRPSPVLILEAKDWPVHATAARIQLWFRPPGSQPPISFERQLDELLESGDDALPDSLKSGRLQFPKAEVRTDGSTVVRILQTHLPPDWMASGHATWIHLHPPPRAWSRTLFPKEGRIEHEFVLERFNQQEFRLQVTPLQVLQQDDPAGGEIVDVELTGIRVPEN
jgi:hypothetical protein